MKKEVNLIGTGIDNIKNLHYIYRISSVSVDKVTLEKHSINLNNSTIDGGEWVVNYEISDDTKVGIVTQKLLDDLIPIVTKMVDEVVIDFKIESKKGISAIKCFSKDKWLWVWIDVMVRV